MSGCIVATKACIGNRKKNLLSSNISPRCPHNMANFGPLTAEICRQVWLGHPCKFQWISCLGFITAATLLTEGQPNFARYLAVSWAGSLYIHFRGLLPPDGILPGANSLYVQSCILVYWQHCCTARQQRALAKLRHGTRNGIMELSQRAPSIFGGRPSRLASAHISSYYLQKTGNDWHDFRDTRVVD